MQPKPEWYGNDFTTKCELCDGIQVNGIHAHSGNFPPCFQNENKTTSVAMEIKYLHVGISN